MWSCNFDQQPPERVAGLMDQGSGNPPNWTDAELGAVLRHQLDTPIEAEVVGLGAAAAAKLQAICAGEDQGATTLAGVFNCADPSVAMLQMVKEFAKTLLEHPDTALPREVAGILYWTSIAAGMVLKRSRITRLEDGALEAGLSWAASREWLDGRCRELIETALDRLPRGQSEHG